MLAGQLSAFDDMTDSKSKRVKEYSYYECGIRIVYFVKISIDSALSQFNDNACKVKVLLLSRKNQPWKIKTIW